MMDFNNPSPEEVRQAREKRLRIRAMIRQQNHRRPRCSGCGNDMPVFIPELDLVTAEQMTAPGYEWMAHEDFQPGDLLCFWCTIEIADLAGQFEWGHA